MYTNLSKRKGHGGEGTFTLHPLGRTGRSSAVRLFPDIDGRGFSEEVFGIYGSWSSSRHPLKWDIGGVRIDSGVLGDEGRYPCH